MKKRIFIIRGAFLNPFELQNFYPLAKKYDLRAISSMHPISEDIKIPLTKTYSLTDLPNFPYKFPILNRLFVDIHRLLGLEQILRGVDIAHVAETYYGYTSQAINAKKKGLVKKVISTTWEVIPNNNEGIWGRKYFKRKAIKNIDHFVAVTELVRKTLLEEGVSSDKITIIPMGVDLKRFHPTVEISNLKSQILNILCVSRLVPEKGIAELVSAFIRLKKKYPDTTLTLVGEGKLKKTFSNIDGLILRQVPYQKIHHEYQKADIFCLPSKTTKYWQEQYGMALVEAMACGLPIITTRTGAIEEVCGQAAIYVGPGDTNDLQLGLERLINDVPLRSNLGHEARKMAEDRYDMKNVAKALDKLYQKILWE